MDGWAYWLSVIFVPCALCLEIVAEEEDLAKEQFERIWMDGPIGRRLPIPSSPLLAPVVASLKRKSGLDPLLITQFRIFSHEILCIDT